ncbi:hypothetical protein DFQ28_009739 [Apophysomyces sp. BC1034]|nr:hypothetical protein DFQ30_005948 [Apophysomyces sp. BC1015]KAG0182347.1 hypothetical protein DFQ29_004587 [Apophysomyces sp. BC1021]KAG0194532.1 hypothetical protein DFQ28_009739 [Apophysomyces sp. BC1034]
MISVCDYAETFAELVQSKSNSEARQCLKAIQQAIKVQQKETRVFCQTVDALAPQLHRRIYARQQIRTRLDTFVAGVHHEILQLQEQRQQTEHELSQQEGLLQDIRDYAQQRRTKKSKRERQYNHFYFIPIVSKQYKKKYIRARDKNAKAEEEVSALRETIERCREKMREASKTVREYQQEHQKASDHREEIQTELSELETTRNYLSQGRYYWTDDVDKAASIVLKLLQPLMADPVKQSKKQQLDALPDTNLFQRACAVYHQRLMHGREHWTPVELEFDCARCLETCKGWPMPNKVRTDELLCQPCYDETRASMIMEKKVNALGEKLGMERPSMAPRASSSSSSFLSKPGVRTVLKHVFSKNSSATSAPLANKVLPQNNHAMMT